MARRALPTAALRFAALTLVLGCSDPITGTMREEVTNVADHFSFELVGISEFSDPRDYTWHNNGTAASITQSTILISGGGDLAIFDASGTEVFRGDLVDAGQFQTAAGTSGDWKIEIRPVNATGSISFDVERLDP